MTQCNYLFEVYTGGFWYAVMPWTCRNKGWIKNGIMTGKLFTSIGQSGPASKG